MSETNEPKQYTLRTLQDVWDNVPPDRIRDCMEELGAIMATSRATADLMRATLAHLSGQDLPDKIYEWPAETVWIDDGERRLEAKFGDLFTAKLVKEGAGEAPNAR